MGEPRTVQGFVTKIKKGLWHAWVVDVNMPSYVTDPVSGKTMKAAVEAGNEFVEGRGYKLRGWEKYDA
jgi:hypothetical protein